jgi:ectoine hydroxylase-related dioxygenase (phytanoyl-CoA dioxygenase family)
MHPLTDELRYRFECHGYVVLPEALSLEEVRRFNGAIDAHRAACAGEWKERSPGTFQHASPLEATDGLDDLIWHPAVAGIVDELMGGDATFVELSIILKEGGTPTHAGWHVDFGRHRPFSRELPVAISAIYYLSDVAPDGGCFAVVPGSHKFTFPLPKVESLEAMPTFEKLAAPAGSVILFHGALWHAAMPNDSDRRRVTVHNYYVHSWMKTTGHTRIPERLYSAVEGDPFCKRLLYRA